MKTFTNNQLEEFRVLWYNKGLAAGREQMQVDLRVLLGIEDFVHQQLKYHLEDIEHTHE